MVADKDSEQLRGFCTARVRGDEMLSVGRLIKALPGVICDRGLTLHLASDGALDHIADHGARMAVRWRCGIGTVRYLHKIAE
jgi:hypothetical protein